MTLIPGAIKRRQTAETGVSNVLKNFYNHYWKIPLKTLKIKFKEHLLDNGNQINLLKIKALVKTGKY